MRRPPRGTPRFAPAFDGCTLACVPATPPQQAEMAEARRLIKSGTVSMVVAALASGAALAVGGPRSAAFIIAAAISILAVLRTGHGIARLRRVRARVEG